ncbi:MAG: gamma carbonic anhydrase family protein [Fulvivirga sp.]|nr:gamma carbonic anhydrase family protein [Fulvivirga sp.]
MTLIKSVRGKSPKFGKDCFLSENATVVGDVTMGDRCSVWFNAVVRGDVNTITIGDDTNIQDGAIIHCTYQKTKTTIGNKVSLAHNVIIHGCTIEDNVLVGMAAVIMDNAVIRSGAVIAAGAVVLPGTQVESNSVYAGIPAKKVKETSAEMHEMIARTARNYPEYAKWYK